VASPYSLCQRFPLCPIESNGNENFKVIQNPGFLPDHPQNWITCSLCHVRQSLKISERSVHNFLSYLVNTQTNERTKTGKNITSLAEVITGADVSWRPGLALLEGLLSVLSAGVSLLLAVRSEMAGFITSMMGSGETRVWRTVERRAVLVEAGEGGVTPGKGWLVGVGWCDYERWSSGLELTRTQRRAAYINTSSSF